MTTGVAVGKEPIEALLVRWRDHADGAALARLFDRTAPDLFRIALSVAPDAHTAEEAVQETFLALLEDPHACDVAQPLLPWLVGVLRHKIADARRRARRVPDPLRLEPRLLPTDPADAAARRDAIDRVRTAIDALPEPYRRVAMLRWEYGLEPGEIAHALGEQPGTVRSTLSRALSRLRTELGGVAALALVLGVRPPDGLAAIRRVVLAKAGVSAATGSAAVGLVVAGVLVSRSAAAVALAGAFALGALVGGGVVAVGNRPEPVVRPSDDVAAAASTRDDESLQPTRRAPRRVGSVPVSPAAPAESPERPRGDEAVQRRAHELLDQLDGTWSMAWKVGQDLARLAPADSVLPVLRERWTRLPDIVDRQNLMKGFDYDGGSEFRVEVFDLGANDPDPRVRAFALSYAEPYAGRRLVETPSAYCEWRAASAGQRPDALLESAIDHLLGRLRGAPPSERADLLDLLADALARRRDDAAPRDDALAAARGWLEDSSWSADARSVIRVIATARPTEAWARACFDSMLRSGGESERRALLLAGALDAQWTFDAVVARLRSDDPAVVGAAAEALADLNDRRAFRPLVDALSIQVDRSATAALVSALQRLTGMSRWRGKDAAWWIDWWNHNRESFDTPTPSVKEEEER